MWRVEIFDAGKWVQRTQHIHPHVYANKRHAQQALDTLGARIGAENVRLVYADIEWKVDEGSTD
jgi:hypothetical protein